MKTLKLLLLITAPYLATSCQGGDGILESDYKNHFVIDDAATIPITVTMPNNFNPKLEARDVENFYIQTNYREIQQQSITWQEADVQYRGLIHEYANNKYINCLRQILAQDILITRSVINKDEEGATEAIKFYANELNESGSANTVIAYNCFLKLNKKLNKKDIKNLVDKSLDNWNDVVERTNNVRKSYNDEIEKTRADNPNSPKIKLYDKLKKRLDEVKKKQSQYAEKLEELAVSI